MTGLRGTKKNVLSLVLSAHVSLDVKKNCKKRTNPLCIVKRRGCLLACFDGLATVQKGNNMFLYSRMTKKDEVKSPS